MNRLKSVLAAGVLATAIAGGVAATATPASADVACNRWGECWRVHDRVDYPHRARVIYHRDGWWDNRHWGHRYHWRGDHDGRGYWRRGVWINF